MNVPEGSSEYTNIRWCEVIYFTTMIILDRVKVSLDVVNPEN